MAIEQDIAKELAATITGMDHAVALRDTDGKPTVNTKEVVYLYLTDKGVMILIKHDKSDVEIWYDPDKTDAEWIRSELRPHLEHVARRYLYGITIRSYAGEIEPKRFVHRTTIGESRNTTKTSYHPLGETKIIVRHSKAVNEEVPGARSRNIRDIFIENNGERFRYPHRHLMGARVMALHVDQGGRPWDELGEKIIEMSRRRKEIMELLRWSNRLEPTNQIEEIKSRGKSEVMMIKRMMERAARSGNLDQVREYQLPQRQPVTENELDIITRRFVKDSAVPGLELIRPQGLVTEVMAELDQRLDKLFG